MGQGSSRMAVAYGLRLWPSRLHTQYRRFFLCAAQCLPSLAARCLLLLLFAFVLFLFFLLLFFLLLRTSGIQWKASKSSNVKFTCSQKVMTSDHWLHSESHNALTTEHDEVPGYRCSSHFICRAVLFLLFFIAVVIVLLFLFLLQPLPPARTISSIDTYGCNMFQLKYCWVRTHFQRNARVLQSLHLALFAI